MSRYANLELIGAFNAEVPKSTDIRIYRTTIPKSKAFRYHLGFPVKSVNPMLKVLESSVGWKDRHWSQHQNFLLWATSIVGEKLPRKALQDLRIRMVKRYRELVDVAVSFGGVR